ncbi:hypothetical protein RKD40_006084 [Streptomyces ambofaciens]
MTHELLTSLRPLLTAEASAEAYASGTEPGDLEQAVWLRLLERLAADGPPPDPHRWLRSAVRTEARRTRRTARHERPFGTEPAGVAEYAHEPERLALAAARRRALRDAVRRLPGRCPPPDGGAAVAQGPHIPGNRGGVGYLTGQSWSGTLPMSGMSASITGAGGCGRVRTGIGVGDHR